MEIFGSIKLEVLVVIIMLHNSFAHIHGPRFRCTDSCVDMGARTNVDTRTRAHRHLVVNIYVSGMGMVTHTDEIKRYLEHGYVKENHI